jgi:hypothetical protein
MRASIWLVAACCFSSFQLAHAQEVLHRREFEKDGVKYLSTTVRTPVAETAWQEREETVYVDRYVTEMQDSYRTVLAPVTQVVYEPRLHNWWNPFTGAHIAYHAVPRTRWELRTEVVRAPIARHEVVPQQRIVRQPVRSLKFVEEERIVRLDSPAAQQYAAAQPVFREVPGSSITGTSRIGGVAQLEGDPPRTSSKR